MVIREFFIIDILIFSKIVVILEEIEEILEDLEKYDHGFRQRLDSISSTASEMSQRERVYSDTGSDIALLAERRKSSHREIGDQQSTKKKHRGGKGNNEEHSKLITAEKAEKGQVLI